MHDLSKVNRRAFLGSTAAILAGVRCAIGQQPSAQNAARDRLTRTDKEFPLVVPGYFGSRPGIQLGTQLPALATEDDMRFARQLGVEWVMTSLRPEESTLENYQALIRRFLAQLQ